MASFRSINTDYQNNAAFSITNQFPSKEGYTYETSPPPMPLPKLYDSADEADEADMIQLLQTLLQLARQGKATRAQKPRAQKPSTNTRDIFKSLLGVAKSRRINITDAHKKILKELINKRTITVDSLQNPAKIIEMVKKQQSQQKSGVARGGPSGPPSGGPSGVATGGPMMSSKMRGLVMQLDQLEEKRKKEADLGQDTASIRKQIDSTLNAIDILKTETQNKAIKQQQKYKGKYQSWDQKRLRVPVRPQVQTKENPKAESLAKAKADKKKKSFVPDSTITKEEVYRKAFFLPSGQKQKVHDALKRGTKPSLVASSIPETYDVPFKSVVLGSAVAAMALSVLLA